MFLFFLLLLYGLIVCWNHWLLHRHSWVVEHIVARHCPLIFNGKIHHGNKVGTVARISCPYTVFYLLMLGLVVLIVRVHLVFETSYESRVVFSHLVVCSIVRCCELFFGYEAIVLVVGTFVITVCVFIIIVGVVVIVVSVIIGFALVVSVIVFLPNFLCWLFLL